MSKSYKEYRSRNKDRRLKNSTRDQEVRSNRHEVRKALKEGQFEILEHLRLLRGVEKEDE